MLLLGVASGQHIRHRELTEDDFEDNDPAWLSFKEPSTDTDQSDKEHADPTTRRTEACPSFTGFVFWPGYDSYNYDIGRYANVPLASMISSCASNSKCRGLNTNGYYKSYIQPLRNWAIWTSTLAPCQGLYIKSPTIFKVNGFTLDAKEVTYLQWISKWTVPYFGMSRYLAIRDFIAKGVWWALKEQVLYDMNAYNFNLCNLVTGDKLIGPLETCPKGRAWQVGIAAVQVPNYSQATVEQRATSVYGLDIPYVLGRSAQQAGYSPGTATHTAITKSTGDLRKSWLLKSHLVGFYFVATEVNNECLIWPPKSWCYGTYGNTCIRCGWYAPDATSIQKRIDEVMVLLQSMTNGVS